MNTSSAKKKIRVSKETRRLVFEMREKMERAEFGSFYRKIEDEFRKRMPGLIEPRGKTGEGTYFHTERRRDLTDLAGIFLQETVNEAFAELPEDLRKFFESTP